MTASRHERARDGLGAYLVFAAALHAAAFALSALRTGRTAILAEGAPVDLHAVNVDVDPTAHEPAAIPGGGSPPAARATNATAPSPASTAPRAPRPAAPQHGAAAEPIVADEAPSSTPDEAKRPAGPDASEQLALAEARTDNDRRDRALATGWTGLGPWAGDEGPGAGWGAPAVRATTPFGNGSHGALTGRVCFLPVDTLRIADVQSCRYVAKVYTDTLDVPERQSFDGFPGVTGRSDWFLIDYTGKFSVTGHGTYEFRLHSDDGSYLYVDDKLVIENDGKHAPESRSGRVQLAVGEHRIRVLYAQTTDRMALQLFVRAPGTAETIFTPQL
ncbi:MAG TPA: PA14 domain-containing protein [Polyangiaceae bacterium]|nr:PA14 domain-containing protein [Polyangiaceae bacterium]